MNILEEVDNMEENDNSLLDELKEKLKKGVVKFSFTKKDGSVRNANGTLKKEIYGASNTPKGTAKKISNATTRFFDVDKHAWRSFINTNLISVGDLVTSDEYARERKLYISQNLSDYKENIEYGGIVFNEKNNKTKNRTMVLVDILGDKKIMAVPMLDRDKSHLTHYNNIVYLPAEYLNKYKKLARNDKYYKDSKDDESIKKISKNDNFIYTLNKNGKWVNKKSKENYSATIEPSLLNEN